MMKLILASTSKYRKKLMADAGFDVDCVAPDYNEQAIDGMAPLDLIAAHAKNKALAVARHYPNDLVIGSDQGLVFGDMLMGKPGTEAGACAQLASMKGQTAILATSVVVICKGQISEYQNRAELVFRDDLTPETIASYVAADMPTDCAGSFKIEARGPRLFQAIRCDDPTAIQGLPMMKLNAMILKYAPEWDKNFG